METSSDELSMALQQMQNNLKKISDEHSDRIWLQTCKNELADKLQGNKTLEDLSREVIGFLVSSSAAQVGTVYVLDDGALVLQYAYGIKNGLTRSFLPGEGLIGQAAREKGMKILNKIPKNYFKIESSLGKEKPDTIAVLPAVFKDETVAVIELGKFGDFSPMQLKLLKEITEPIAISINTLIGKKNLEGLVSQLKAKEQDLKNHINAINKSNATVEFDLNGNILSANEIFLNLLGYTESEVMGRHHSMFVEKAYASSKEYRQFWNNLKKGEFQQNEFKRIHKSGESVWLQGNYNPIFDTSGKVARILKIASDITTLKKQQIEIDAITSAIYKSNMAIEFDMSGIILKANDIFLDIMGYKENEIIGKHHSIFVEKGYETTGEYFEFWNNLRKGEYQQGEFRRVAKSGEVVWIKGNYNPILDTQGKAYKILKIATDVTLARKQSEELQVQAEELQTQQEELKQMNEELEEQAQTLKQQQEELQTTNEELEEQTQALETKNKEMENARIDIEQKSRQLEISSKYKSEFLANMSHELRTPLNSLLILAQDLAANKNKNLSPDQVESAEIIYNSGKDLLGLINEVLDLSKIEAGKMVLTLGRLSLKDFAAELSRNFRHQLVNKGLDFNISLDKDLPETIRTDHTRLNQIIKNLLSNAIKFTDSGSVDVRIRRQDESHIAIVVKDTGIGIADDKQIAIFEAFFQADGSTSRKYGGTGLGLSISRELTKLLSGEIKLESKVDKGSTFTLILPVELQETQPVVESHPKDDAINLRVRPDVENSAFYNYPAIPDDRAKIENGEGIVLIIDDDPKFSELLLKQAHEKGFRCLTASTGESGLLLAEQYKPIAIILDINLPGIDGHRVLSELKANPRLRHIPVHIISAHDWTIEPIKAGAVGYLTKPLNKEELENAFGRIESFVTRKMKNLLIVEDDANSRKAMKKLIGDGDVKCFEAGTAKEALSAFQKNQIDCIVLDLGLPDMSGTDLINEMMKIKKGQMPPVVIYTGKDLSKQENAELQKYADTIIIKGVKSEDRLLDETALFLHRTISDLPERQQKVITSLYNKETALANKRVLLVDDDMRNVYALSRVLKDQGVEVLKAENGQVALNLLGNEPSIDLVLMDIMMPEMDGYEAMRKIREQVRFRKLPVIALTAKAMKEDRQKCLDAGASDYISKPVDIERLFSLMRVWLSK